MNSTPSITGFGTLSRLQHGMPICFHRDVKASQVKCWVNAQDSKVLMRLCTKPFHISECPIIHQDCHRLWGIRHNANKSSVRIGLRALTLFTHKHQREKRIFRVATRYLGRGAGNDNRLIVVYFLGVEKYWMHQ